MLKYESCIYSSNFLKLPHGCENHILYCYKMLGHENCQYEFHLHWKIEYEICYLVFVQLAFKKYFSSFLFISFVCVSSHLMGIKTWELQSCCHFPDSLRSLSHTQRQGKEKKLLKDWANEMQKLFSQMWPKLIS